MSLTGAQLIAGECVAGSGTAFQAINPADNTALPGSYHAASHAQIEQACVAAEQAAGTFGKTSPAKRADLLEAISDEIEAIGDQLTERGSLETGLPTARLQGERGRTVGQLRMFSTLLRDGDQFSLVTDEALPERTPMPRPRLVRVNRPIGPIAVFGASNFPLAFSAAGGDTASALAAGCPVVVKAHPSHPGTSELVGRAVQSAVAKVGLPAGIFSVLFDQAHVVGAALVRHPAIKAVGFTGSRSGGLALAEIAASRAIPIPVHAEMGSINPVFYLPAALAEDPDGAAQGLATSMQMGAGQFCTQPGLVVAIESDALDRFVAVLSQAIRQAEAQTMLSPQIWRAYEQAVIERTARPGVELLAQAEAASNLPNRCRASLFSASAKTFQSDPSLAEEIFGATSLLVRCANLEEMLAVARSLEGQLTATLQAAEDDAELAQALLPIIDPRVGRVVFNGYPTGVEVCASMMHGGPYPASTDGRTTSVGTAAIQRWLRPICYQNVPEWLNAVVRTR